MISMKSIEKIGVKGYAFKNYVCQELSFAEFSGRRSCAEGAQVNSASLSFVSTFRSAMLRSIAIPLKLSEAEFSEYHQPKAAACLGLNRSIYCRTKYSERTQNFGNYG